MTSATADPHGAQAHARAQAGTKTEAMPILPARDADALPAGVAADAMLWAETLAGGGYASKIVGRGARIELTDLAGDGCISLLAFNAECAVERLNVADTLKVQWHGYLGAGRLLLSDMGRVLLSIVEDEAGTHDAFCGASNRASNARRYGDGDNHGAHPNARDRFRIAVAKYGLGRKDIHPCVNFFKGVRIAPDGATQPEVGPFAPNRRLVLRAEMDLILVLANCPHVLDPRADYHATPVRVRAWRDAVAAPDDPIRTGTPEGLRAFLNTEAYYAR
ncbi:urea carboxylase-associated family protein [Sphingomonas sp. PL-96]|uniref:urea amidolyase associated protein UAAP1 n=1 Tax=Sphingomonas sp. PL-96 TaxID=2887201 RepID=UPI001E5AF14D|nr:urea amidolyase associated protein UAAP1 [Sphingomonas sp. PL-96]MCC2978310.1 urea carboxylase-associated family protein [Sphingomonas sp. PL-96]